MNAMKTILAVVGFFILVLLLTSVFTITQGYQGIQLRLGKLVQDSATKEVKILFLWYLFLQPIQKYMKKI